MADIKVRYGFGEEIEFRSTNYKSYNPDKREISLGESLIPVQI